MRVPVPLPQPDSPSALGVNARRHGVTRPRRQAHLVRSAVRDCGSARLEGRRMNTPEPGTKVKRSRRLPRWKGSAGQAEQKRYALFDFGKLLKRDIAVARS